MSSTADSPLQRAAEQVAARWWECGFAFVEDDHVDRIAELLRSFLIQAGIATHPETAD